MIGGYFICFFMILIYANFLAELGRRLHATWTWTLTLRTGHESRTPRERRWRSRSWSEACGVHTILRGRAICRRDRRKTGIITIIENGPRLKSRRSESQLDHNNTPRLRKNKHRWHFINNNFLSSAIQSSLNKVFYHNKSLKIEKSEPSI